ncbi:ABC transporter permease [Brachybacterium sp. Z12]|uniref:ABC transporter permease n=1 Tax=Brachybacterium sp. Z12 TaxID=2759167 RepID=UPI00185FAC9C|nr:ABC transporter permease [Brachybacterium sp. Z12]QNN82671.1 ABC transporter permease [Brachybacterium sp. Z12]
MSHRTAAQDARIDRTATSVGSRLRSETAGVLSSVGKLRIPELVLFFGLIFEGSMFGLPIPLNQVVIVGIVLLAITRRPQVDLGWLQMLVPLLVIGLFYLAMLSMFTEATEFAFDWERRLLRLGLTAVFLLVLASGRIDLRSGLAGLATGMILNAIAFYLGLAPDNYGGVLSGFFLDKNVAGMAYAIVGVLVLAVVDRRWVKVALVLVFAAMVWLTGSRTSIAAMVAGVGWILIAPRLPVIGRWMFGLLIYLGVDLVSEDYSQIGVFSNREGSDLLRSRIDAASEVKVDGAGFFGMGLGEAYVSFPDDPGSRWLFHNSYWSALVEGGWPWLLLVLGITVVLALRPFETRLTKPELAVQAAAIAVLICAWRLGEVFFTLQWALVVGAAIWFWANARQERDRQIAVSEEER